MKQPSAEVMEMRRLVGKFAMLFAFIYFLVLLGGVITVARHSSLPIVWWPLLAAPGCAFVPAVVDAVRLHRSSDPDRTKELWRRCGILTLMGVALLVADAVTVNQVTL
jgi:hypothetical protein